MVFYDSELQAQHEQKYDEEKDGKYVNEAYRSNYKRLNDSKVVYNVVKGSLPDEKDILGDFGSKDGKQVTITIDVDDGGNINDVSHEFVHGAQFEDGKVWFTKVGNGDWSPVNNSLKLEQEAYLNQIVQYSFPLYKLAGMDAYKHLSPDSPFRIFYSGDSQRHLRQTPSTFGWAPPRR